MSKINKLNRDLDREVEVFSALCAPNGPVVELLSHMNPAEKCWQPCDFLPTSSTEQFYDELKRLRKESADVPDSVLNSLVCGMITEEALPNYQSSLSKSRFTRDLNGTSEHPAARWIRWWSAEENRHGEILGRYLYLTGRVNMRVVDTTVQNLIRTGFDAHENDHFYLAMIYTCFQERTTWLFNQRIARQMHDQGHSVLPAICLAISGDESRHELFYKNVIKLIAELDPEGALCAFDAMTRTVMIMPGFGMSYGSDKDIYSRFSILTHKTNIYTPQDYAETLRELVNHLKIESMKGLSSEHQRLQDKICKLPERYQKIAERAEGIIKQRPMPDFPWMNSK